MIHCYRDMIYTVYHITSSGSSRHMPARLRIAIVPRLDAGDYDRCTAFNFIVMTGCTKLLSRGSDPVVRSERSKTWSHPTKVRAGVSGVRGS